MATDQPESKGATGCWVAIALVILGGIICAFTGHVWLGLAIIFIVVLGLGALPKINKTMEDYAENNERLHKGEAIIDQHIHELTIRRNQLAQKLNYSLIDGNQWTKEVDLFIWNVIAREIGEISKSSSFYRKLKTKIDIVTADFEEYARKFKGETIIDHHARELSIRRGQLTHKLNYGLIDDKQWIKEVDHFIKNVITPEIGEIIEDSLYHNKLLSKIDAVTAGFDSLTPDFSEDMDPVEYEQMVAKSLGELGWRARLTTATGDQGIDVVAEMAGVKIVIQCKLYSGSVGNTAVQEAIAGRTYEKASYAAVVTNAGFTRSARQLASSSGVFLLHHDQLSELASMCMIEQPHVATTKSPVTTSSRIIYDVILASAGDKKINVIKEVRDITGLGLKEAKDLVDSVPQPIRNSIRKEEALAIKARIEKAGGRVTLQ
jgi:restriction system protein